MPSYYLLLPLLHPAPPYLTSGRGRIATLLQEFCLADCPIEKVPFSLNVEKLDLCMKEVKLLIGFGPKMCVYKHKDRIVMYKI